MTEDPGKYRMPFGKYRKATLDNIASTDGGLKYLDWCAGEFDGEVQERLLAFLRQPTIAAELSKILEDD